MINDEQIASFNFRPVIALKNSAPRMLDLIWDSSVPRTHHIGMWMTSVFVFENVTRWRNYS